MILFLEQKRKEFTDANHKHYLTHGKFRYFLKY